MHKFASAVGVLLLAVGAFGAPLAGCGTTATGEVSGDDGGAPNDSGVPSRMDGRATGDAATHDAKPGSGDGATHDGSPPGSGDGATGSDAGGHDGEAPDAPKMGDGEVPDGPKTGDGGTTDANGGDTGPTCTGSTACALTSDCPTPATACVDRTCVSGCCGTSNATSGTTCSDNGGTLCNGDGACVACLAPADCPASPTTCKTDTCAANACGTANAASGTTCTDNGGTLCDGNGTCVACLAPSDCPASTTACKTSTCTGSACGTANAASGTPCTDNGGSLCDGNGTCVGCLAPSDCPASTTTCASATCSNGACGSLSEPAGTTCSDHGGVVCNGTGACVAGTCMDGFKDDNETDVDCGGACPPCPVNKKCTVDADCSSMACDASSLLCVANQCADHHKDGSETDVDCGGGTCPACATGKDCHVNIDCTSMACDEVTDKCVASTCSDQRKDGSETDVDCGGGACPACATGEQCVANTDCISNACDAQSLTCDASQCADHKKDGMETDIDCGGGSCPACVVGKTCSLDVDCSTNACDGVSHVCVANQCADHRLDGTETDVDCGGVNACARCPTGEKCVLNTDCMAAHTCTAATHTCS